ncbi:MAG: site-specific DNA-methyltransferase [Gemmatimonadetes bacterium]|nr:site-specific DNA-methyltransferase [Gemmatimonadota bacterium]MYF93674.1 site-specific DNA-methyltransferase [Gemmatimonadota bacterium]
MSTPNRLYFGDCLDVMREFIPDKSVDLIYLDPPFNSKRIYNANMGGAQWVAFKDTWQWHEAVDDFHEVASRNDMAPTMEGLRTILGEGSDLAYLSYMANRLLECFRVLTPTGSIYLHCDPTMNYLLRVLMNSIFVTNGSGSFRNEIVWFYPDTPGRPKKDFARKHDTVFRYTNSTKGYIFNADAVRIPILDASKERYKTARVLGGRKYVGGESATTGKIPEDVWRIASVKGNSAQSCGYPTQKPLELLQRIIKASSIERSSVVLDPFCGCGTTLEAAQGLDRQWIGIDICTKACQVIEKRFRESFDSVWSDVEFIGMPKTVSQAHEMASIDPFRFETWAASLAPGMEANKKQRGDGGIDGWGRIPLRKGYFADMVSQVKGGHTNPGHVQAFNGARQQAGADMGIFTCFEDRVTNGMRNAAASTGRFMDVPTIQIYTVEDFFANRLPQLPRAA